WQETIPFNLRLIILLNDYMHMAPTKVASSQVLIVVSSVVVLLLSRVSSFDGNGPKGLKICGFDAIYNFGDSYSDTGNAIHIDPTASQSHPPYGTTINKITGRCSDGLLPIDYIANSAGFPSIKTYLNSHETDSRNGVNFAVSGATALPLNVVLSKLNISAGFINNSLTEQLQWFNEHLKGFCQTDCKEKLRSSLFIIGIGSNEYNLGFFHFKKAEEMKKIGLVSAVVEAIQKAVEQVIGYGATRVLVPGTYPTGCAPGFLGMFRKLNYTKDTHGCLADVNDLYKYHNDQLQAGLEILRKKYPGVSIIYGDYYNAVQSIMDNLQKYGYETITGLCCGQGRVLCGQPGSAHNIPIDALPQSRIALCIVSNFLLKISLVSSHLQEMGRSKKAQKPQNQVFTPRRSARLADKFNKLPEELILTILSKIQDPKTLICCSSVSKNLNSLISRIDSLSLRLSYPDEDHASLPCLQSHHHIPQAAIPGIIKVFPNIKFLELRLCPCPSPSSQDGEMSRLKFFRHNDDDDMHCELTVAFEVGFLSGTSTNGGLPLKLRPQIVDTAVVETNLSCVNTILPHCPKTLRNLVISSAKMQGPGSRGEVFVRQEVMGKLADVISSLRTYEGWLTWLNDPRNVAYWLKDPLTDEQRCLREIVWAVRRVELPWPWEKRNELIVVEGDVKELLSVYDYNDEQQ
ncbi:unnamed protein product, partial [Dovyalis caffra]